MPLHSNFDTGLVTPFEFGCAIRMSFPWCWKFKLNFGNHDTNGVDWIGYCFPFYTKVSDCVEKTISQTATFLNIDCQLLKLFPPSIIVRTVQLLDWTPSHCTLALHWVSKVSPAPLIVTWPLTWHEWHSRFGFEPIWSRVAAKVFQQLGGGLYQDPVSYHSFTTLGLDLVSSHPPQTNWLHDAM